MKPDIILLAHGSRDERWKAPFENILLQAQQSLTKQQVGLAYMEMSAPSLKEVADMMIANGSESVVILPLFMASGGHLRKDVPEQVEQLKALYPQITVSLEPPIGEHSLIQAAMLDIVKTAAQ